MLDSLNTTFSENPVAIDMQRSTFTAHPGHTTTLNSADLVPIFFADVMPGDSFSVDTSFLCRMSTPIFPVMANAFIDFFYFYVPYRIVWSHFKEFLGENTNAPWTQTVEYNIPQLRFRREWSGFKKYNNGNCAGYGALPNSVVDYLGISTGTSPVAYTDKNGVNHFPDYSVTDLPNRAYRLIWNEFFRDENLQSPVPVYLDDSDRDYYDSRATFEGQSLIGDFYDYGGKPLKVNKFHDYYTSCLPAPQKGPSVGLNLSQGYLPVKPMSDERLSLSDSPVKYSSGTSNSVGVLWQPLSGNQYMLANENGGYHVSTNITSNSGFLAPSNLYAFTDSLTFTTVSALREAFAIQRLYEAYARGGTRYREILKSIFGVTAPDARVQVPEYLGGTRVPINMDQVLQTSSTDNVSPQGNTAGYSLTTDVENSFTKSFVEHGCIIGLACIRVEHTYSQGIMPYWMRKRRFDFYYPQLANISEQGVPMSALCASGFSELDSEIFGYQEAWADYRFIPSRISGGYSPISYRNTDTGEVVYENSQLAQAWTYADFYELDFSNLVFDEKSRPTLSPEWISEDPSRIGGTLALPTDDQFLLDLKFNVTMTRPMPVRSVPGLIDHH